MKAISKKLLLAASVAACFSSPITTQAAPGQVYVNLFEWKWNDIAQECAQNLKPAGFSAVQISVPTEAKSNNRQWWERYQPASYKLDGRSGSRQELANMVAACRKAGIAIYADVVINHMANGKGTGESGSFYNEADTYNGPGYTKDHFHGTRCEVNDSDAKNIHDCWLGGDLPDLKTENTDVRKTIGNYLKDLLSLGIAGFRIDAAKHIPANDLKAILEIAGPVNNDVKAAFGLTRPWVTGEIFGGFGPIDQNERGVYFSLGTMNEFKYKDIMRDTFDRRNGASISQLASIIPINDSAPNPRGMFASRDATVFVSNHDTERHPEKDQSMNASYGKMFNLANIFMLAYPYGQPQLQSGFKLSYPTDSNGRIPERQPTPTNAIYNSSGIPNFSGWDQQHRWPEISNMVEFRNQTQSKWQVDDWTTNGPDRIAFHRGDRGFVAINRDNNNLWVANFKTGMAPGKYCNVINGQLSADKTACSGDVITVKADSTVNLTIPSMSQTGIPAVAIHAGQKISTTVDDVIPPSIPSNFVATEVLSNKVSLKWDASTDNVGGSGMDAYAVLRNGVEIARTSANVTTYIDNSVSANTDYQYTVVAIDKAGKQSAPCNILPVKTLPIVDDIIPPSIPTNFVTTEVLSNSVSLKWNPSTDNIGGSGMDAYAVIRNGVEIGRTSASVTTYTDKTALPNTQYQYSVVAIDKAGKKSAPCNVLPVTTPPTTAVCLVPVTFQVRDNTTVFGQDVYVTGNKTELGNWNTASAIKLSGTSWPLWTTTVKLLAGSTFEYKYLKKGVQALQWETGTNRSFKVPACGTANTSIPLSDFRR